MNNIQTIRISAKEIKDGNKTFIACTAKINGNYYKIKFTKTCEKAPKTRGIYDLTINFENCSVERGKPYTNKKGVSGISNPSIWVREIVEIHQFTEEDYKRKNAEEMSAIFEGVNTDESENLPF